MLVIVMHNNREYLDLLKKLTVEKGFSQGSILEGNYIGTKLVGGTYGMTAFSGQAMNVYKMAFITYVKGVKEVDDFIRIIKNDNCTNLHNMDDEGIICVLPYLEVAHLDRSAVNKSGDIE